MSTEPINFSTWTTEEILKLLDVATPNELARFIDLVHSLSSSISADLDTRSANSDSS